MTNTSSPRTFSSMTTKTSLSGKRRILALVSGVSSTRAMLWASVRLELPASSFIARPFDRSPLVRGFYQRRRGGQGRSTFEHDRREQTSVIGRSLANGPAVGEEQRLLGDGVAADPFGLADARRGEPRQDIARQVEKALVHRRSGRKEAGVGR